MAKCQRKATYGRFVFTQSLGRNSPSWWGKYGGGGVEVVVYTAHIVRKQRVMNVGTQLTSAFSLVCSVWVPSRMMFPTHRVGFLSSADPPGSIHRCVSLVIPNPIKIIKIALAFPILASLSGHRVKSAHLESPSLFFPWFLHDPWKITCWCTVSNFCGAKQ